MLIKKCLADGTIEYYLGLISALLIPLYHWYMTPIIVIWGIVFLANFPRIKADFKSGERNQKILLLLFVFLFLWQMTGLIYSENLKDGLRNITLRLPILILPLILIFPGPKLVLKLNIILKLFTLSTFTFFIVCLLYASYRSFSFSEGNIVFNPHPQVEDWLNYFYASKLAISQHPSYLSLYVLISIFIALEYALYDNITYKTRFFWIIVVISLMINIYLLSSRAELLACICSLLVYFGVKLFNQRRLKIKWLMILILIILPVTFFMANPRIHSFVGGKNLNEIFRNMQNESRISIWKLSFEIIKENPILGVGTGDIQNELNRNYILSGKKELLAVSNLNTHNQFIEILTENGLIGFFIFLAIIYFMLMEGFEKGNLLLIIFIIMMVISLNFETMLNRLAGLVFFPFIGCLLMNLRKDNHKII